MMDNTIITSVKNPRIKKVLELQQKSSERRKMGCFVVEGKREILHGLHAGFTIDTLYVCSPLIQKDDSDGCWEEIVHATTSDHVVEVSPEVYDKMAYRGGTEGLLAVFKVKSIALDDLKLPENPLIVVLESVEKPGNLGAVLRSADAAAVDAVMVCDPLTDLYNPNLIRSSIGAIFTVPCVACTSQTCIDFLKRHSIQILTAQLQDSKPYYDTDMTKATAIIMGTESTGLTQIWREAADAHVRIPMQGQLDSLNVSVSAAILIFEAVRQRMA